jgi:hypothetical protein
MLLREGMLPGKGGAGPCWRICPSSEHGLVGRYTLPRDQPSLKKIDL